MSRSHFRTSQPGESRILAKAMARILPGRLFILICLPYGTFFLTRNTKRLIEDLGSLRISQLAFNETWLLVGHTGKSILPDNSYKDFFKPQNDFYVERTKIWFEGAFIIGSGGRRAPPAQVALRIPKIPMPKCEWEKNITKKSLREFCNSYEGYPEICTCDDPVDPKALRHSTAKLGFLETIPVALLTAVNAWNFYRQILNILSLSGASETPIFVFVDGHNREINEIATLFNLPVFVHRPQGWKGSYTRLNMHFRFSVYNIFELNPRVDKAIILEDDLILSPDFFLYFHQLAWLLDEDPTIYSINAFSINSYPKIASDPTRLRRSNAMPQFGWLINRRWASTQLPLWIPEKFDKMDWDWWLGSSKIKRDRDVISPEVSRIFHAGSSGAHVTAWDQSLFYNQMIFNQDANVTLSDTSRLLKHNYDADLRRELLSAQTLKIDFNPCSNDNKVIKPPVKAFKIFVYANTFDYYKTKGFIAIAFCLHAHIKDYRDIYEGVQEYRVNNCTLFIVGCPISPFCSLFEEDIETFEPVDEIIDFAENRDLKWRIKNYPKNVQLRRPPKHIKEDYQMTNLYTPRNIHK